MNKEKLKKICGYSYGDFHFEILFNPYKKHARYQFFYGNRNLANFDTEEKARLYADAFQEGLEACENELLKVRTIET